MRLPKKNSKEIRILLSYIHLKDKMFTLRFDNLDIILDEEREIIGIPSSYVCTPLEKNNHKL